jgi:hypothetical protein
LVPTGTRESKAIPSPVVGLSSRLNSNPSTHGRLDEHYAPRYYSSENHDTVLAFKHWVRTLELAVQGHRLSFGVLLTVLAHRPLVHTRSATEHSSMAGKVEMSDLLSTGCRKTSVPAVRHTVTAAHRHHSANSPVYASEFSSHHWPTSSVHAKYQLPLRVCA